MATPIRRIPGVAATIEGINFGSLDFYTSGGGLPEGDYCLFFNIMNHQAVKQNGQPAGPSRLGVMVDAYPLDNPTAEGMKNQFYSMGSNADKAFAPNPDTGKSLVAIPGGPGGSSLNISTNWALLLKSLYDSGLPAGIFTNDFTVLDGIHVHVTQVPEPEERKGFQGSQTGEASAEPRVNQKIAIITEIKDTGKPWEGTGGLPDAPAAAAPVKPVPAVKGAIKAPPAKPAVVAAAPAAAPPADDADLNTLTVNAVSTVLESNPMGMTKLLLRTNVFKSLSASSGAPVANQVLATYFGDDAALNSVIGLLGYTVAGAQVKPIA